MTNDTLPDIDRHNPTPIYRQIQDWMRSRIQSGAWPEYYQLPAEIDLAAELKINRGTLRNAIQQLIEEGLLMRIHGKGTFVAANGVQQSLAASLTTFSESLDARKIPFETHVRAARQTTADMVVAPLLAVELDAPIFYLERVRTVKGQAIVFLKNYIPYPLVNGIEQVDFTRHRLFKVLEQQFGIEIAWGRRYFEARVADAEVAAALGVTVGDPIMYAKQITCRADGRPLEMSDIWFVGHYFRLSAVVNRKNALSILSGLPEVMQTEFNIES
ncbi:MAG: GntR family transcriptional regulator [Anaerolineae bacterium]|nr:GntR family transcriptional regulator [Anaerolineae bacterium]